LDLHTDPAAMLRVGNGPKRLKKFSQGQLAWAGQLKFTMKADFGRVIPYTRRESCALIRQPSPSCALISQLVAAGMPVALGGSAVEQDDGGITKYIRS
jgi:hypothetical protein